MVADMDYYRLVRRTDPSYTEYNAFKEWIGENPDVAVELAEEIWPDEDFDSFPKSWDEMRADLQSLDDVMDVFFAGYFSNPNVNVSDDYFVKDAYGHYSSLTDREYVQACVDFMRDGGYYAIVIDKKYPVPKELAEVLALWGTTVRTENIRPTARKGDRGRGSCGTAAKKAPSKSRKKAGQSKKSSNVKSRNTKSSNTSSRKTAPAGRGVGGRRRCI